MTADTFVAIPAYDEPMVLETVAGALDAATRPVRVGVVLQDDDPEVERKLLDMGADVHAMPTAKARGLGWARATAASMWEDEPWYYQTDGHMTFEAGWDEHFIRQAEALPSRGVLSAHPLDVGDRHPDHVAVSDIYGVTDWGVANGARRMPYWGEHPLAGRTVSAANQFYSSDILQEVPIDPHIMFWGEEHSTALRFWTRAIDIWHPGGRTFVRHKYMHKQRVDDNQYWVRSAARATIQQKRTWRRVDVVFGRREGDLGVYGVGSLRTVAQWERFARVDLKHKHGPEGVAWVSDERWRAGR